MSKWDFLVEGDTGLRELERKARASGLLRDWVAYRSAGMRGGKDPLQDMRDFIRDSRDSIYVALGINYKNKEIPLDLDATGTAEDYKVKVVPSTGAKGAGSRIKIQCPMCGDWVGAAARVLNGHLNRNDHNRPKK